MSPVGELSDGDRVAGPCRLFFVRFGLRDQAVSGSAVFAQSHHGGLCVGAFLEHFILLTCGVHAMQSHRIYAFFTRYGF